MAVILDVEALLAEAGSDAARLGREHVAQGRVSGLTAVDGGARATVADADGGRSNVAVTIIGQTLVDDCDRDNTPGQGLCEHAVAVVMAATDAGITWAPADDGTDGPSGPDEHERMLAEAAADLTRTELVKLVVAQANADRLFATKLLQRAGRLTEAGPAELDVARNLIEDMAAVPEDEEWEIDDLIEAGEAVAAELELLALRPASAELLAVVEEAIMAWDSLAEHLVEDDWETDGWETDGTEPSEIGERLADIHLELCEELRPDPVPLARRLAELVDAAEVESCLDAPDAYADLLGDEGLDAYEAALAA
jgi:uncharacterized Zn finger protein